MTNGVERPALAEVRARTALHRAGLDARAPLERASSVTNEVWLTPTHVVRVNRRLDNRLAREVQVAACLPPTVGYPRVVAYGGPSGEDWLIAERVPGTPLAHQWPDLTPPERRRAIHQLADRLEALHKVEAPVDLPAPASPPHLLALGTPDPVGPVVKALEQAADLPHVDGILMREAIDLVRRTPVVPEPGAGASTLIHGDVTFENILWDMGHVTALLDVEWARPASPDLDLDILLRCCAYPSLHVADRVVSRTHAKDYAQVPEWLAEAYPDLFAVPNQLARMRVYSIAYDARELLAFPPPVPRDDLPPTHAHQRISAVVRHRSYLDALKSLWT